MSTAQSECISSDYRLCFTLKQHTPMIHFQADQKGATLRATELKPKFDRFLIEYFKEENERREEASEEKIEYEKFFIKDQRAFDYKVSIISITQPKFYDIDLFTLDWEGNIKKNRQNEKVTMQFPTFFATMGDEWKINKKYFSYTTGKIILSIKILNQELKKYIEKNIASFLAYTNFGTRQSKGFGSFYLHKDDRSKYISMDKALKLEKYWSFEVSINDKIKSKVLNYYPLYGETYSLFEKIELLYKTLRSGINLKKNQDKTVFYFKSLLQNYVASSPNYDEWDKAVLKAKFIDGIDKSNQRILSRDMLGLSTIQEYKNSTIGSFTVRHPNDKKDNTNNQNEYPENKIQRFKSPIILKPIKINEKTYRVYITHRPLDVFDVFKMKKELLIIKEKGEDKDTITISLPTDFDLVDFLEKSFEVKIERHVEKFQKNSDVNYLEHDNCVAIKNIYESIQEENL